MTTTPQQLSELENIGNEACSISTIVFSFNAGKERHINQNLPLGTIGRHFSEIMGILG